MCGWGRNVGKLNDVGGESKSPPGMSQETPELFIGEQSGQAESNNIFLMCMMVL